MIVQMSQIKLSLKKLMETVPEDLLKSGKIGTEEMELVKKEAAKKLHILPEKIRQFVILRRSIDARKKEEIVFQYRAEFSCPGEKKVTARFQKLGVSIVEHAGGQQSKRKKGESMQSETAGAGMTDLQKAQSRKTTSDRKKQKENAHFRPVVVGFGPAGMFAALTLARAGLCPAVIERGKKVEERQKSVEDFWRTGVLEPESNVLFGEGGAGTFSDGKLNTMVKDPTGTGRKILQTFVDYGAPEEILYLQKPHIGTDRLREVVAGIRKEIIRLGGEVLFETKLVDLQIEAGRLRGILLESEGKRIEKACALLILATGHSARDVFQTLKSREILLQPKAFAIGLRVEHPQEWIGRGQYGESFEKLPAADYKLTFQTGKGRGVYSFCMCPGGFVVNASSESDGIVVNGMSNYRRDGRNANSAIVVTVSPEDFGSDDVLAGVEYQRKYERAAFREGGGKIPVQLFGDFQNDRDSTSFGGYLPEIRGHYTFGNLRKVLPAFVSDSIAEGMQAFGRKISGFDREEVILSGIESRTSSPVRILRNEKLEANVSGIYPCGEGAGYAGGIMSAAMDGIRVAERILEAQDG